MTLEKIRAALPTHIMLTPGHHVRLGDETVDVHGIKWELCAEWATNALVTTEIVRRPVPPHILDNQAFWIWFDLLDASTRPGLKTQILGAALGQPEYRAGRLYDKWLLEQMEDV